MNVLQMCSYFTRKIYIAIVFTILLCSVTVLTSCQFLKYPDSTSDAIPTGQHVAGHTPEPTAVLPTSEPTPTPYTVTGSLVAVGDVMVHQPQIDNAYDSATKSYDFTPYFREVHDFIQQGDWKVANLETTLAGAEAGGYSGYPMFNTPEEIADALKQTGFNIMTTANNHSLDRREIGVLRTLEKLQDRGFQTTGTYATEADASKYLLVTHKEITIGFLAYTYGTNGIPFPEGKTYLVNVIELAKIKSDIQAIRQSGADLVSVSLHFGNEYQRMPSEQQMTLAKQLIQAGADVILGSHPHVVQPIQWLEVKQSDGSMRKGLIVYSMGNFISSQMWDYKDVGMMINIQVSKSFPDGIARIDSYQAIPTFVYRDFDKGKRRLTIIPLDGDADRFATYQMNQATIDSLNRYRTEMGLHFNKLEPEVTEVTNK
jgi:poly-gamma-glutamate capsule biosynthesis protein CapA/YwtB (metallophosphatase superfamily)